MVLFLAPVSLALEGIDTIALGEEKPVESLYFMGKLYVMSQESKKVTRIDVGNNRVIDTATLGRVPVFATATNKKIYFQHTDTKAVSIFDTVENKVIKTLST
ncbi:hypothetical protein H6768_04745 [Candidatus Peribacteria bacterium]|nr:hypothetical protein [Candidatus Peribacteria bacterium]